MLTKKSIFAALAVQCFIGVEVSGQALGKAYFYVAEGAKRCFFENTPADLPVTISYTSHDIPGVSCSVSVYDVNNRLVANKEVKAPASAGKLTYLTKVHGQHTICAACPAAKMFGHSMIKWTLSVDLGDTEINFEAAAKGTSIESNSKLIKGMFDRIQVIRSEDAYKEEQELLMHSATESISTRVVWCAVAQMAVMLGSSVFAVINLSRHFKSQKLVAS